MNPRFLLIAGVLLAGFLASELAGLTTITPVSSRSGAFDALPLPGPWVGDGDDTPAPSSRASASDSPNSLPVTAGSETASAAPAYPSGDPPGPDQPTRLQLADLGIDVSVRSMSVAPNGVVDPPTRGEAYWIKGYGDAAAKPTNTMYIAGHSSTKLPAAFTPFLDIASQQGRARAGQIIAVVTASGTQRYRVTDAQLYVRRSLASVARVWEAVPGRLVLITCFQYDDGRRSDRNYVVYADREPPAG